MTMVTNELVTKSVDLELVKKILNDPTFSGKSRFERIIRNNSTLSEQLSNLDPYLDQDKIAKALLDWNDKVTREIGINGIAPARDDIKKYIMIIDDYASDLDSITDKLDNLKKFNYKHFCKVVKLVSDNSDSKIIRRINNIKLVFEYYKRVASTSNETFKRKMEELLIKEVTYQKGYIWSLLKNFEIFPDEYFMLGLLLFDIPGSKEHELEINRILKSIGIIV